MAGRPSPSRPATRSSLRSRALASPSSPSRRRLRRSPRSLDHGLPAAERRLEKKRTTMNGAGNPLNYDYRDPRHVERYAKLVVRNPDGSTEGKHPRDADVDVMREIHEPLRYCG